MTAAERMAWVCGAENGRFFTRPIAAVRLIRDLCARSGPLTAQEWKAHIPDVPYRNTC
ncbi:hypothetical protein [Streptomyces sp. NPDC058247]|uniref:hypothetical protein n=1 Tax=Streptomyces sp. NPDC058247 TaxID=3346401 RepID=UPI0036E0F642